MRAEREGSILFVNAPENKSHRKSLRAAVKYVGNGLFTVPSVSHNREHSCAVEDRAPEEVSFKETDDRVLSEERDSGD